MDKPESPAAKWFQEMLDHFGSVGRFPHIGCGSNYVPWAKGPSMVCEVLIGDSWEAFLADHTPSILDDKLKHASYMALSRAMGQITPEQMFKAIPVTMPMTHLAYYKNKQLDGIAKYPVDAWVKRGNPSFTTERWGMICMALAERALGFDDLSEKDRNVFEALFTVSTSLAPTP